MKARVGVALGSFACVAALVAACSSFADEDKGTPGAVDGGAIPTDDATSPAGDGSTAVDAAATDGSTADATPVNTSCPFTSTVEPSAIVVEDFGASGCDGWTPYNGTPSRVQTDCGTACRFCLNDGEDRNGSISHTFSFDPGAGTFAFSAWVRSDDAEDAGVGDGANEIIDIPVFNSTGEVDSLSQQSGGFSSSWLHVQSGRTEANEISAAQITLTANSIATHGCFLITNVRITRTP